MLTDFENPLNVRRIIHVDMDAFFAAVEQRDHPELRGKPVAVGRARSRGVVAAASYEARVFGVRSAMPSVTAIRKCPDLIFVTPRFDVYRAVSAQIHAVFRRHTDLIEPLSLDEAYLDVTETCASGLPATSIAEKIREEIRDATGLTASAGVSFNKFLAKLASDQDKPDGLTVITPRKAAGFIEGLPVARFHGVGPVTEAKMHRLGIHTGADLKAQTLAQLREHFGSSAERYHDISRGLDDRPVRPNRERKSVGAETTLEKDIHDLNAALLSLEPLIAKIMRRCKEKNVLGHTVTLKVKYADFELITRRRTLEHALADPAEIEAVAGALLEQLCPFVKGIRLLGVSISALQSVDLAREPQLDLFAEAEAPGVT